MWEFIDWGREVKEKVLLVDREREVREKRARDGWSLFLKGP